MSTHSLYSPSLETVSELFKQGDLVPIYGLLPADIETPGSVFVKIFDERQAAFLLESVEGGELQSRYSFIGIQPHRIINSTELPYGEVMNAIREEVNRYQAVQLPELPGFTGGAVGYFSYDTVRYFERIPDNTLNDVEIPEAMFMIFDSVIIFDHVLSRLYVLVNAHNEGDPAAAYADATRRIDALVEKIRQPLPQFEPASGVMDAELESTFTQSEFEAAVEAAKEYIRAGDAFQIVLSQRLSRPTTASQIALYRALRLLNPSPYTFLLHFPATATHDTISIVGASPEQLVKLENGIASVRPIAGTRPRGKT
ncbi:MAG TPA: chorismate-binding protein, partial [Aggregatilineales bacterium]|nr:chorismate-binding protein [Aggregatilineales bacterium]